MCQKEKIMTKNEKTVITVEIFPKPDVPNINGTIYTKECVDNMYEQLEKMIEKDEAFVHDFDANEHFIENNGRLNFSDIIGKVKNLDENTNSVTIETKLDKNLLKELDENDCDIAVSAMSMGIIDENNVVKLEDYNLIGLTISLKKDLVKNKEENEKKNC
jgi:hypothetical protein